MAKASGGTRSNQSIKVSIEAGYDKERANRMVGLVRKIAQEEGINVKEVRFLNRDRIEGNVVANAYHKEGRLQFGNKNVARFLSNGEVEVVAHELGHLATQGWNDDFYAQLLYEQAVDNLNKRKRMAEKNINRLIREGKPEKAERLRKQEQGSIEAIEKNVERLKQKADNRNKKNDPLHRRLNDLMISYQKEYRKLKKQGLKGFSDYAYNGGIREFMAEAFAFVVGRRMQGKPLPSNHPMVEVYDIMKRFTH